MKRVLENQIKIGKYYKVTGLVGDIVEYVKCKEWGYREHEVMMTVIESPVEKIGDDLLYVTNEGLMFYELGPDDAFILAL